MSVTPFLQFLVFMGYCIFFRAHAVTIFWLGQPIDIKEERLPPIRKNSIFLTVFLGVQCPDSTRFVRKQLFPAFEKLWPTGRLDITIIPFGKGWCIPDGFDFRCQCQHGPVECELSQLMACSIEQLVTPDRYMPLVACIQGKDNLEHAKYKCLSTQPVFQAENLMACALGPRGRQLLAMAEQKVRVLNPPLDFVPWVMLNNERVVDAMYALDENICQRLIPPPEQCYFTGR